MYTVEKWGEVSETERDRERGRKRESGREEGLERLMIDIAIKLVITVCAIFPLVQIGWSMNSSVTFQFKFPLSAFFLLLSEMINDPTKWKCSEENFISQSQILHCNWN